MKKTILQTGSRGFSLLEVLISMAVLSIGLLGLAGLATTAIQASTHGQMVTQAANVAQDRVEALLSIAYTNMHITDTTTSRTDLRRTCALTGGTAARPVYTCTPQIAQVTIDGRGFTWSYTVTHIDLSGDGVQQMRKDRLARMDVTVTWTDPIWHVQKSLTTKAIRGLDE
jgi:type IV pilus modification protein PilV